MTKLVVMIPCFNEEKTIGELIRRIPKKIQGIKDVKILVMNDGSSDATEKIAKQAGADKIHSHYPNKGLGINFKLGIEEALKMGADIVVNIDADLQFAPEDIPKIIKPIIDNEADVVTATRFKDPKLVPEMPAIKKFGNEVFTKIISALTGKEFTDTQCGFRAYNKEACLRLNIFGRFTYTQEVLLDLVNKKMKIIEVPVKVKGEREGKSRIVKNWWSYSIKALIIITRTARDNHPLKFFGSIGLFLAIAGIICGAALFIRWLITHTTSPYGSLVLLSATLLILGFLMIMLGLIADMNGRQKQMLESIIYEQKKHKYSKNNINKKLN